jgi:hypothetical protein
MAKARHTTNVVFAICLFQVISLHSTIRTMLFCLRGHGRTAKAREGPRFSVTNSEFPVD